MSRIATLTAVLTMIVAPAAFATPADYRSPDAQDAATTVFTKPIGAVDLRSPDAAAPVRITASGQDLRSPDAADVFLPAGHDRAPSASPQSSPSDGGFNWGIVALIAAALAACAGLAVMLRRHLDVGGPVGV